MGPVPQPVFKTGEAANPSLGGFYSLGMGPLPTHCFAMALNGLTLTS